jgi:acyl carrier protein
MTTNDQASIESVIKEFILAQFLPGEDPAALTDATPLVTTGLIDSIGTLKLVTFLEERFRITVKAHEIDVENFNTVTDMTRLIRAKLAAN